MILFISASFYILISSLLLHICKINVSNTTLIKFETNAIKHFNKSLIYFSYFWFPISFFLAERFHVMDKIWFFMLNFATSYVWGFFFLFFFCFFNCSITYHLIMVNWHKHLYLWVLIYAFIICLFYIMPYFTQNYFFGCVSDFIFDETRYVFIFWSSVSYLTGWLFFNFQNTLKAFFSFYLNKFDEKIQR